MAKTSSRQSAPKRARPPRPAPQSGPDRRLWIVLAVVAGLVVIAIAIWGLSVSGPSELEQRTQELTEQEEARDREQIQDLTDQARELSGSLAPVLEEMVEVMPPGEEPGAVADAATVAEWQSVAADAVARFEDPPSGSTGTNVARNSLALAADAFAGTAETYALALDLEGEAQTAAVERAAAQRDIAVRAWSVGATQLDALNVDAGFGHQHVYLEAEGTGALTPDSVEEGTGATDG